MKAMSQKIVCAFFLLLPALLNSCVRSLSKVSVNLLSAAVEKSSEKDVIDVDEEMPNVDKDALSQAVLSCDIDEDALLKDDGGEEAEGDGTDDPATLLTDEELLRSPEAGICCPDDEKMFSLKF